MITEKDLEELNLSVIKQLNDTALITSSMFFNGFMEGVINAITPSHVNPIINKAQLFIVQSILFEIDQIIKSKENNATTAFIGKQARDIWTPAINKFLKGELDE